LPLASRRCTPQHPPWTAWLSPGDDREHGIRRHTNVIVRLIAHELEVLWTAHPQCPHPSSSVLEEVRLFYRQGFDETGWQYDEEEYKRRVLTGAPKDRFRASLLWLVDSEAITLAQADRLDAIYAHRHELSHELTKYIVDPDFEPSLELFTDALVILKAIRRFWSSVEKDIGSFEDFGDVDLDEVVPLSLMVLQQCIDAYAAGLET
jgi:hypothetical protein